MRVFVMDASRNGQRQFKFITALVLSAEGPLRYGSSLRTTGTTRNIFVRQRRAKALVEVSFFPCNQDARPMRQRH